MSKILKTNNSDIHFSADLIYPVGSIYMSVNDTNPTTLFGGTWEQIKDKFLLSCGDTYANGSTGGEATHTLTIDEMPSHTHSTDFLSWTNSYGEKHNNPNGTGYWYQDIQIPLKNTGGDQPHNNMPPYLAVYVWKRTSWLSQ